MEIAKMICDAAEDIAGTIVIGWFAITLVKEFFQVFRR